MIARVVLVTDLITFRVHFRLLDMTGMTLTATMMGGDRPDSAFDLSPSRAQPAPRQTRPRKIRSAITSRQVQGFEVSPTRIAGVIGAGRLSETRLMKLRQSANNAVLPITLAVLRPNAIVSRLWCD